MNISIYMATDIYIYIYMCLGLFWGNEEDLRGKQITPNFGAPFLEAIFTIKLG